MRKNYKHGDYIAIKLHQLDAEELNLRTSDIVRLVLHTDQFIDDAVVKLPIDWATMQQGTKLTSHNGDLWFLCQDPSDPDMVLCSSCSHDESIRIDELYFEIKSAITHINGEPV